LWITELRNFLTLNPEYRNNPAYFQELALKDALCLQFGFSSMGEGLMRHKSRDFKYSHFETEHQRAITCYVASLNMEAFPFKQQWEQQLIEENFEAAKGVWGLRFTVTNGHIIKPHYKPEVIKRSSNVRYYSEKPIFLPTPNINESFASIGYTSKDAERVLKHFS
jgi:hypothetical protein